MEPEKQNGRPPKGATVMIGLRVPPELKRQLEERAAANHRNLSQECERALERSFERIGRPLIEPVPGERYSLGLKVTADIKSKLDKAARESGRTQSQEAEMRLERSFLFDDMLKARLLVLERR